MSVISRFLPENPVLTKELRVRMRGTRAYWILFGYLAFLSFVLLGSYASFQSSVAAEGGGSSQVAVEAQRIFLWLGITQMFLVLFITPAITSGAITLEREQRTLDMLTMTRMPRRSIIIGKLLSAISFTALLLISSLPMISICFMLGSIDPAMVMSTYIEMLFGSFLIGAMGLMWSSIAKNTSMAVMITYATLVVLGVLGAIVMSIVQSPTANDILSNAFRALWEPQFGTVLLGVHVPAGTGFALTALLTGILMSAIATARLEMFPERRAWQLRGLTALLVGLVTLSADQWWLSGWYRRGAQAIMSVASPPIGVLMVTTLLLMLLVPTFATGVLQPYEIRRLGRYLLRGWTPAGLSRANPASGIPYLLLLTLLCLVMFVCSFVLVGKSGDALHSASLATSLSPAPAPLAISSSIPVQNGMIVTQRGQNSRLVSSGVMPGGMMPTPPASPAASNALPVGYTGMIGDFPQAACMLIAFVAGFSLLCLSLSIVFNNRWVAWMMAFLFLAVVWIAPERARAPVADGMPPGIAVNLYYLNPEVSLFQMGDPTAFWHAYGPLPMGSQPMWLRVSEAWVLTGALSLLLMIPVVSRERKRGGGLPDEALMIEA